MTRSSSHRRVVRLLTAGTVAAILTLLVGVTAVSPSVWNVIPFVNGVRGPSSGTAQPTGQAVTSSEQVVTPQVDTATSSQAVLTPAPFTVSEVTYPAAATSSSQVVAPGSFSSSLVAYPLSASSSVQVVALSSFESTVVTYPRSATPSAQTIAPSSFSVTPEPSTGPDTTVTAVTATAQTVGATDSTDTPYVNGVIGSTMYFQAHSAQTVTASSGSPTPFVNGLLEPTADSVAPTTVEVPDGVDTDGDAIPDAADNCPDDYNPDQTNTDADLEDAGASVVGDPEGDACDADDDNDGFDDDVETYVGTVALDNCACGPGPGGDAWPLDNNMDCFVTVVGDVLNYAGRMGAWGGPPADPMWMQRLDLNMDNYITVVGDVLPFSGMMGESCT